MWLAYVAEFISLCNDLWHTGEQFLNVEISQLALIVRIDVGTTFGFPV